MRDSHGTMMVLLDATRRMGALRENTATLADVRTDCVRLLRADGYTFADIGTAIDVTPQAVAKIARRTTKRTDDDASVGD